MKNAFLAALVIVLASGLIFSGCYREASTPAPEVPSIEKLTISNIVFCPIKPEGYMGYIEQPDAIYEPGDVVWIYLNVPGAKYNPHHDGTNEIWYNVHLTLKASNGDILLDEEVVSNHHNIEEELDPDKLFFSLYINTTPQFAEDKYAVEIVVTDKIGNQTATASIGFTLSR
ncbi:hypothetical protein ACFLTK_01870 [Chloroflexota bacterium]